MKQPESKLPWTIHRYGWSDVAERGQLDGAIFPANYTRSEDCKVYSCAAFNSLRIADAEYIVEACNNYPKTIELLKEAYRQLDNNFCIGHIETADKIKTFLKEISI